jgi:restriction system protein
MTILDACVEVLKEEGKALTAEEIYERVVAKNLYGFGAKDPLAVLRQTIRKHLKRQSGLLIREDTPKHYRAV